MSKQATNENKNTKRPSGVNPIKRMLRNREHKLHSAGRADSSGRIYTDEAGRETATAATPAAPGLQSDETLKPAIGRAQDRRKGGR